MTTGKWMGALLALAIAPAFAADTWFGASIGYEHSDNIANSENDAESESILLPRLDGTVISRGGRADGAASFYVAQARYQNETFDDEMLYNLLTSWDFELLENRLYWILDDLALREVVDTRDTSIESNRTDQNYLVTGPRLEFGSTPRRTLWLSGLYSNYWYGDEAGIDSERFTALAGIDHRLSRITTLTLWGERTDVQFTEDGASDFERDEFALALNRELDRNQWLVEVGYNRIRPDRAVNGESVEYDGPMGRFRWRQHWTRRTYTLIHFTSILSDAGYQAIDEALRGGVELDQNITTDIFRSNAGGIVLHRGGDIWSFDLGARAEREIYESEPLDQDIRAFEIRLGRLMAPNTTMSLRASSSQRDYRWLDRRDNNLQARWRIDHAFSPRWFGAIAARRMWRNSNEPGADFEETVVSVEFGLRGALLAREQGARLRDQGLGER